MNIFRICHPYYECAMKIAERFGVRDTIVAALLSAVFVDLGIVTENDRSRILDRCAVRRQRSRCRKEIIPERSGFSGLYFDGKTDKTIQPNSTFKMENHLTLLNEPGSEFICHKVLKGHKANDIFEAIEEESNEDIYKIKVLGADGTCINTGKWNGALALIEKKIGRKCHWNVCIPFRMLIIYIISIYLFNS